MTDDSHSDPGGSSGTPSASTAGWFAGDAVDDIEAARRQITTGSADSPRDWPTLAVEAGAAESTAAYYDRLHDTTVAATRETVRERERADDQQLVHAVRAMDDCERTANELAERAAEWAGSLFADAETGIEGMRAVAARDPAPGSAVERRVCSLAHRVVDLADERDELAETIELLAPAVAPNLAEMAGPELAARLIALAGGLESLAKKPAGTVQVLGAEDALFAHLSGRAPSPKHGIIYTHEFVRTTPPEDRGSAARALAGKLALAARADHYAGERRAVLHEDLRDRMATIRARAQTGSAESGTETGSDESATNPEGDNV